MERAKIITLIKLAVERGAGGFSKEELDNMKSFLNELENEPTTKRSSDDWRGCQGTCDFDDPGFNITGWIQTMDIKIEYDVVWPNLCRCHLIVYIDDVKWDFGCYSLKSGGEIHREEEWNMWATEGPWDIWDWPEGFPDDDLLKEVVLMEINSEIPHGCCGGCI